MRLGLVMREINAPVVPRETVVPREMSLFSEKHPR